MEYIVGSNEGRKCRLDFIAFFLRSFVFKNFWGISCILLFLSFGCYSNKTTCCELKRNGKILCEIVVPEEAGPVAFFAGEEMKTFLSQVLGAGVPLRKRPTGKCTAIILGNSKQARKAGVDVSKLPRDAFVIKTNGSDILIVGRDSLNSDPMKECFSERGTLFGVYEFLERFAGVRFYFPGEFGTIVPKKKDLSIPETNIYEKPDYIFRRFSWEYYNGVIDWLPQKSQKIRFARLEYLRLRLSTEFFPCGHGLASRNYVERFKKTHPEYLALMENGHRNMDSQLCLSSNIREEIYKDAKAFFLGKSAASIGIDSWCWWNTQPGYFDVMPQDGFYKCRCENCQAHFKKGDQATSDFVWGMVVEVAKKLKEDGIPGYLTMGAYTYYRYVPTISIPDNIKIRLSLVGPWNLYRENAFNEELNLIRRWIKQTGGEKIQLWNYTDKFGRRTIYGIPSSTPKVIGKYYKEVFPYVSGVYMETNGMPKNVVNYIHNYLNNYVFSKLMWNHNADVNALLDEHYRLMFGAGSAQMKTVFEAFENNWLVIMGVFANTPPFSSYDIWKKVYTEGEINKLQNLFNDAEKATAHDSDPNKRVKFIRREFLDPIIKQREAYLNDRNSIDKLHFNVKELSKGKSPTIDGKLDDVVWEKAEQITLQPYISEKSKKDIDVKTTVKALKDAENLYFAFECSEPNMDKLVSSKRPFDTRIWEDSSVEIFLNPSADRDVYYHFVVNADGSLADMSNSYRMKSKGDADKKWDSGAVVAVSKGTTSWNVEIAIPLKSLPGLRDDKPFPANFCRNRILANGNDIISDHAALFTWSPFLKKGFHDINNFAYLKFQDVENCNIIKNGSFNNYSRGKLDGWIFPRNLKAFESCSIADASFCRSGKCVQLKRDISQKGSLRIKQHLPDLKPDTEYQLSYAIKIDGLKLFKNSLPRYSGVILNIWDGYKNIWIPYSSYISNMPWTCQGSRFRTGADSGKFLSRPFISLVVSNAACTASFGDVKLIELNK